jgi:membrane-associated phospholipid phosphatase
MGKTPVSREVISWAVMRSAGVWLSLCVAMPGALHAAPPDATPADAAAPVPASHELSRTSAAWLAAELAVTSGLLATSVLVSRDAPDACRWCSSNDFDEFVRSSLVARRPRDAGMLSDIAVAGVLPSFALAALLAPAYRAGRRDHALENVVIVATATGLSLSLALGLKTAIARERPAAHHGELARGPAAKHPRERYLSFYSSHAAAAFAAVSSVTSVSYLRGYDSAPYVALAGGVLGAGVGVLRIAADMHWATDVLVGAGVGTLVGMSVPLLLHRRTETSLTLVPVVGAGRAGIDVRGSF